MKLSHYYLKHLEKVYIGHVAKMACFAYCASAAVIEGDFHSQTVGDGAWWCRDLSPREEPWRGRRANSGLDKDDAIIKRD